MTEFSGKIALITGAGRGIGRALAVAFARQGAHVIAVSRMAATLEELDDFFSQKTLPAPTLVPLDITQYEGITRLGASLYQRFGRLDILIGNAGYLGELSPIAHTQPQHWQKIFDINATANFWLLRNLDPLLRQSDDPHAVFTTAQEGREAKSFWGAYAASKAALERLVMAYAAENSHVKANLIEPFRVKTDLYQAAFPGKIPDDAREIEEVIAPFLYFCSKACQETGQRFIMGKDQLPISA